MLWLRNVLHRASILLPLSPSDRVAAGGKRLLEGATHQHAQAPRLDVQGKLGRRPQNPGIHQPRFVLPARLARMHGSYTYMYTVALVAGVQVEMVNLVDLQLLTAAEAASSDDSDKWENKSQNNSISS